MRLHYPKHTFWILASQTGVWRVVRAGTVGNTRVRIFQQSQGKGLGLGIRRGRRQELSPISGVKKSGLSRRVNLALVIAVGFDAALKPGDCKHPRQLFTTSRTPSEETLANPRVCNFNFCYISSLPRVLPSKIVYRMPTLIKRVQSLGTLTNATAKLNLYFIRLMLKRLANDVHPKWVLSESQRE